MTFYRTYRPQTISELDNEEIRKRLTSVLSSDHLPHAFLFAGPKGIGKTSSARIIAKAINCRKHSVKNLKQNNKNIEPCNQCDICKSVTNGLSLDILEIDAASNRGIDEIRDLREKIKLAPSICRYKVYIIDEVHMLTTEAFNALLKTLEEPPIHAVFILCTTEPRKLPATIISRCLRFDFKKAGLSELVRSLKRIVDGEKLDIKDLSLKEIAQNADGSFREAAKILEQLSFDNKKIQLLDVKEFLGRIKLNQADELLKLLVDQEIKAAILWLDKAVKNNADVKIITLDLLEILRNYLLKKTAGLENEEIDYGENYEKLTLEKIWQLITLFSQAYLELKTAVIPQLPLELAIVEWGSGKSDIDTKKQEVEEKDTESNVFSRESSGKLAKNGEVKTLSEKTVSVKFNQVVSFWPQILEAVKPLNHSVHAVLKSARPLAVEENILIIEAFYKFHKERLEEPKVNTLLTQVVCDKLGCRLGVKCVLGEGKKPTKPTVFQESKIVTGQNNDNDLIKAAEEIFK